MWRESGSGRYPEEVDTSEEAAVAKSSTATSARRASGVVLCLSFLYG